MSTDPRLLRLRPLARYHLRRLGPLMMRFDRCPLCARRTRRWNAGDSEFPFTLASCGHCGWNGDPRNG